MYACAAEQGDGAANRRVLVRRAGRWWLVFSVEYGSHNGKCGIYRNGHPLRRLSVSACELRRHGRC